MFRTIDGHIKLLNVPKNGNAPYCNCTFIDDQVRILIDGSCGTELASKIQLQGLDVLILTHFHYDHILCANKLGASQIWCHQLETAANESLEVFQQMYGFHQFGGEHLGPLLIKTHQLEPKQISRGLTDGEILDFGKVRLRVIHTPGHTSGHTSFFVEESGILISGDVFYPWYGCFSSDLDEYLDSINKCMELHPRLVINGHNGILEGDLESKFLSARDRILRREEKILQSLQTPQTVESLAAQHSFTKSGLDFGPYQEFLNKYAIYNHLKRLIKMARIRKDDDYYFRF
jgi:glyoxylase-like metal-dependent hydrolase (beta-lactamase superfamily II)